MKFNEKLQKLRKENKMSQEQLADLLDVSRQAVSKWESGTTYPEMDKLLMLCKIFKCTLDELTNDDILDITVEEKEENAKKNWINVLLDYLNKTIHMIKDMSFHDILSMILKMFIVFLFLAALCIPVYGLYILGSSIFLILGEGVGKILSDLWLFLLIISYVILAVTIFFYTFKIQYLDNFEKKENLENDKEVKIEDENNENNEKTKVQIVYRDNPTSTLFQTFGKLCTYMLKGIIFFLSLPFFVFFAGLFIILILLIYGLFNGIFYIGFLTASFFSILLVYCILKFLMEIIFSKKTNFNRMFQLVIISIAGIGIAIGISIFEIADSSYENTLPDNVSKISFDTTIPYQDGLHIGSNVTFYHSGEYDYFEDSIKYVEDNNLTDAIRINISYVEEFLEKPTIYLAPNKEVMISSNEKFKPLNKILLNDLRNKKFHNYELLYETEITIYGNKQILQRLQKNLENKLKQNSFNELSQCREQNRVLQERLNNDSSCENLEHELEMKQQELQDLQQQNKKIEQELKHYKNTLQDLITQ